MKTKSAIILLAGLLMGMVSYSQDQAEVPAKTNRDILQKKKTMKTYVIEREIPNAGKLTQEELRGISQKSNEVVAEMGPAIEWQHSYVTDDKVFCVYRAENEELLKEHAEKGGFPVNGINELSAVIDAGTAQ